MTKLIFLDIDGVLTSVFRGNSYLCQSPRDYKIDEICWSNLQLILDKIADIKVVIHSNWRKHQDTNSCLVKDLWYFSLMPEVVRRLGSRYVGYPKHYQGNNKGGDIRLYLTEMKFVDPRIIILDDSTSDDLDKVGYNSKFIQCNEDTGLNLDNVDATIKFFN